MPNPPPYHFTVKVGSKKIKATARKIKVMRLKTPDIVVTF